MKYFTIEKKKKKIVYIRSDDSDACYCARLTLTFVFVYARVSHWKLQQEESKCAWDFVCNQNNIIQKWNWRKKCVRKRNKKSKQHKQIFSQIPNKFYRLYLYTYLNYVRNFEVDRLAFPYSFSFLLSIFRFCYFYFLFLLSLFLIPFFSLLFIFILLFRFVFSFFFFLAWYFVFNLFNN